MSNVSHLLRALKQKMDCPLIGGYRSSSIDAITVALDTGFYPGRPSRYAHRIVSPEGKIGARKGSLYFLPNPDALPKKYHSIHALLKQDGITARKFIDNYTGGSDEGIFCYAMKLLGAQMSDSEEYTAVTELMPMDEAYWKDLHAHPRLRREVIENTCDLFDVTRRELHQIFKQVYREGFYRKGFLIGFDARLYKEYPCYTGDEGWDLFIQERKGLPIEFIRALRPLGYRECQFIESLKRTA